MTATKLKHLLKTALARGNEDRERHTRGESERETTDAQPGTGRVQCVRPG